MDLESKVDVATLPVPAVRVLVQDNLSDFSARHLMILTKNSAALPLMFGCGLLDEHRTTVLIGSIFDEVLAYIRKVNRT